MNDNWIKQKIDWLTAKVKNLESGGGGGGSTNDPKKVDKFNPISYGSHSHNRRYDSTVGVASYCEGGMAIDSRSNKTATYISAIGNETKLSVSDVNNTYVAIGGYMLVKYFHLIIDVDYTNKIITVLDDNTEDLTALNNTSVQFFITGNISSSYSTHAEGANTTASGIVSHAEGYATTAQGYVSHAEGRGTTASGWHAHAEGRGTTAQGYSSHAEGYATTASGNSSHAEGYGTTASGDFSHAQNRDTIAQGSNQTAIGAYNVADTTSALIIGGGTGGSSRKNIMTVDWEGNILANSFNGMKVTSGNIDSGYGTTLTLESGGQYMMIVTIWNASGAIYANGFYFISVPSGNSYASANPSYYRYGSYSGYNITLGYSGSFKMVKSYTDYSGQYSLMKIG